MGRIDLTGAPLDWVGTGWLVAENIIVTNRHVAREFAERKGDGFAFKMGLTELMGGDLDFLQEIDNPERLVFKLVRPLHIEEPPGPDVSFFEIEMVSGDARLANPIELASTISAPEQLATLQVATIGYPAYDSRIPEPDLMERIYGKVYNKKAARAGRRDAPGRSALVAQLHDARRQFRLRRVRPQQRTGARIAFQRQLPGYELRRARRRGEEASQRRAHRPYDAADRDRASRAAAGCTAGPAQHRAPHARRQRQPDHTPDREHFGGLRCRKPRHARAVSDANRQNRREPAEFIAETEAVASSYRDRRGYDPAFLGQRAVVDLPTVDQNADDILDFEVDGATETELRYEHFSVVMSRSRRMCFLSACNIDGNQSRKSARVAWKWDPRIPKAQQIMHECYGSPPKFSRGHMTRREDPGWGSPAIGKRGNEDSMHVTNTTPQMQAFNAPIWLALEDYALQHAREDEMKISVFTGPYFTDDDPEMYGVRIPLIFWKVIAFIHDQTGKAVRDRL